MFAFKHLRVLPVLLAASVMLCYTGMAFAAATQSHVHIAVMFKTEGHEAFKFPAKIVGEDILGSLGENADFLALTQTVSPRDGDIISLQNDLMRGDGDGNIEDFGVNCVLSVHTVGVWTMGGKCDIILSNVVKGRSVGLIKPTPLAKEAVWYNVWEDANTGVAIYFFRETGAVLTQQ
ncbi:MAG: hypothetical protein R8L53_03595 [Mariprofundales bacterium]